MRLANSAVVRRGRAGVVAGLSCTPATRATVEQGSPGEELPVFPPQFSGGRVTRRISDGSPAVTAIASPDAASIAVYWL